MPHVMAAAVGLSLLLAQSALAFTVVKVVGAAYLVYTGVRLLLSKPVIADPGAVSSQGARRTLVEGIAVEALNVKTALFFLAFLPQFVATGLPLVPQLVLLGTVCGAHNTSFDLIPVLAAHRLLKSGLAQEARARLTTRISGVTMIGLGVFPASARRQAQSR